MGLIILILVFAGWLFLASKLILSIIKEPLIYREEINNLYKAWKMKDEQRYEVCENCNGFSFCNCNDGRISALEYIHKQVFILYNKMKWRFEHISFLMCLISWEKRYIRILLKEVKKVSEDLEKHIRKIIQEGDSIMSGYKRVLNKEKKKRKFENSFLKKLKELGYRPVFDGEKYWNITGNNIYGFFMFFSEEEIIEYLKYWGTAEGYENELNEIYMEKHRKYWRDERMDDNKTIYGEGE
jgi:hypothetical protein